MKIEPRLSLSLSLILHFILHLRHNFVICVLLMFQEPFLKPSLLNLVLLSLSFISCPSPRFLKSIVTHTQCSCLSLSLYWALIRSLYSSKNDALCVPCSGSISKSVPRMNIPLSLSPLSINTWVCVLDCWSVCIYVSLCVCLRVYVSVY